MELKIYEKGEVVKTYEAETFTLSTGVCEDLLKNIDIDKVLSNGLNQNDLGIEIIKVVTKSFPSFKYILMDIFPGLTEEEYRKSSIKDVAGVIIEAIKHMVAELNAIGGNKKK